MSLKLSIEASSKQQTRASVHGLSVYDAQVAKIPKSSLSCFAENRRGGLLSPLMLQQPMGAASTGFRVDENNLLSLIE